MTSVGKVRLVLFPQIAESPKIDPKILKDGLERIGLIGSAAELKANCYLPGGQFMSLVTFLGCSPTVTMAGGSESINDPNTYYIELPDASDEIRLIAGTRVRAPICPQCGVEKTYKREIPGSALDVIDCDQCMYKGEAYRWNWRRQAGFGRTWINIWGVHEGEAVPGEKLLDELEKLSGFVWNYAYCGE